MRITITGNEDTEVVAQMIADLLSINGIKVNKQGTLYDDLSIKNLENCIKSIETEITVDLKKGEVVKPFKPNYGNTTLFTTPF